MTGKTYILFSMEVPDSHPVHNQIKVDTLWFNKLLNRRHSTAERAAKQTVKKYYMQEKITILKVTRDTDAEPLYVLEQVQ